MSNVKRTELEILDKAITLACENENLRHQLQKAKESKMCCACYKDDYKLKKGDIEGLKRQLTILDDEDVVVEITVKQFEEYKKLKSILTEIKEIAENTAFIDNDDVVLEILQKFSECEVEDEF